MTERDSEQSGPGPFSAVERGVLILLLAVIAALVLLWWRRGEWRDSGLIARVGPPPAYANKLDPNTAGWQSLMRAPGIGEQRAKAIVEYRGRHGGPPAGTATVFRKPEDLLPIAGFGPATVGRIAPLLAFSSPATSQADD